jgi:Na+/melibiose symporter-like transporter
MTQKLRTYTKNERNIYLLGMAGENILAAVVTATLSYYLQFTILIPALTVSVIMVVARAWDALNDPVMGTIVDRTKTKLGKCRPYLLAAPFPVYIATVLCFLNFGFYDASKGMFDPGNALILGWAFCTYMLWVVLFTMGDIPLWGITALMTENDKDRAKLLAYARIALLTGAGGSFLLIQPAAIAMGSYFERFFTATERIPAAAAGERMGFIVAAAGFGLAGAVLFQLVGVFVKERVPSVKSTVKFRDNFSMAWQNKPFRQILLSGILCSPKTLLVHSLTPLITYYYASKNATDFIFYMALWSGSMFAGQIIAMSIVPMLIKSYSKIKVYNAVNLLGTIPFLTMFALYLSAPASMIEPSFLAIFILLLFAGGAANGFSTVLQSILVADAVDYEEYKSGIRPDGLFFSGLTFIGKLGSGISVIISGICYAAVGFSGANVAQVNDYIARGGIPRLDSRFDAYMMILFFLVCIPPAVGGLLAVIPTWRYALSDGEHSRILKILNERRHEKSAAAPVKPNGIKSE